MRIWYICEICGSHYTDQGRAEACQAQGKPKFKFKIDDPVWVKDEFWNTEKPGIVFDAGIWHQYSGHRPEYEVEVLDENGAPIDLLCKEESQLRRRENCEFQLN